MEARGPCLRTRTRRRRAFRSHPGIPQFELLYYTILDFLRENRFGEDRPSP